MRKIGNYIIGNNEFAKGAFSKIYLGYHKHTKIKVAVKEISINKRKNSKKYIKREIEIHKKLKHMNIVQLYEVLYESDRVYMVMEFCDNGSLSTFQNKRRMNEMYVQNFIYQLVQALKYLRKMKISHRDLKPHNLLVCESTTLKLSDFGLAKEYNGNTMDENLKQTYCGSPMYMSPEILSSKSYDTKSDLWSIGIIIYEMLTGELPFKVKNINQLIKKSKIPIQIPEQYSRKISAECLDLLGNLFNINSKQRISWDDFFNHPWLETNHLIDYENNLIYNPLNTNPYKPLIFEIEDNISSIVVANANVKNIVYIENNDDEDSDLFLSASSIVDTEILDSTSIYGGISCSNVTSSLDELDESNESNESSPNNKKDNDNSTVDQSYVIINKLKFTDSLESSSKCDSKIITTNSDNIINLHTKSKPINIKKPKKYDFHNEENIVDVHIPVKSMNSLDSNHSKNVRYFLQGSIEILKQSYKYISSNNNNSI